MKRLLWCLALVACGSNSGGGGGTSPDAAMSTSTCKNYTPPALPDSQMVWHDADAAAKIAALMQFSVSGDSTFDNAGRIVRFSHQESSATNSFTVSFTYDNAGHLVRRSYDAYTAMASDASGPPSGSVTTRRAPPVGARSGAIARSPPCSIAIFFAIARPRPVPVDFVVT